MPARTGRHHRHHCVGNRVHSAQHDRFSPYFPFLKVSWFSSIWWFPFAHRQRGCVRLAAGGNAANTRSTLPTPAARSVSFLRSAASSRRQRRPLLERVSNHPFRPARLSGNTSEFPIGLSSVLSPPSDWLTSAGFCWCNRRCRSVASALAGLLRGGRWRCFVGAAGWAISLIQFPSQVCVVNRPRAFYVAVVLHELAEALYFRVQVV